MNTKLVLLRHGQSLWNKKNIFTGWVDVRLSSIGTQEAIEAGRKLKRANIKFTRAYTSVLSRAIQTLWLVLDELDQMYLPVINDWKLNERHYGGLTGLNKKQMMKQVGTDQVQIWRRSYDIRPPKSSLELYNQLSADPRYANLKKSQIPWHESLKDTCERAWPYYQREIEPCIKQGQTVIISAHGNSLRGLVKHLDNISDKDIPQLEIPTGQPLIYEFTKAKGRLKVAKKYYL